MAGLHTGAALALGAVAVAGAAIAGMEKALTAPDPGIRVATPAAAPPPPPAASAPPDAGQPGAPAPNAVGRSAGPPCAPPVRFCVQLSGSSAWLVSADSTVLGPVPVRHGRPGAPTPVGLFPVESKNAAHVNSVTGAPMPFAMFFAGDLALYQAELDQPSAGSVRLAPGPAELFFRAAAVGDLIQVVP